MFDEKKKKRREELTFWFIPPPTLVDCCVSILIVAVADSFNDQPNRDGLSRVSVLADETVGPARLARDGRDGQDKRDGQDGREGRHGWFNLPRAAQPRAARDTVGTATRQSPVTPTLLGS